MRPSIALAVVVALAAATAAAKIELPQASPGASVELVVGTTKVAVDYYRPGVKGRTICLSYLGTSLGVG